MWTSSKQHTTGTPPNEESGLLVNNAPVTTMPRFGQTSLKSEDAFLSEEKRSSHGGRHLSRSQRRRWMRKFSPFLRLHWPFNLVQKQRSNPSCRDAQIGECRELNTIPNSWARFLDSISGCRAHRWQRRGPRTQKVSVFPRCTSRMLWSGQRLNSRFTL